MQLNKVRNFWKKKLSRKPKNLRWKGRAEVSTKRLRIGGRFITKEKAFVILGMA